VGQDTFAAVIHDYIASPDFQEGLRPSSQRLYRHILRMAEHPQTLGSLPVLVIRPALVQAFLDGLSDRPALQKLARGVLAAVEKWALVRDRLHNPIMRGTYTVETEDTGHEPWPEAWVDVALAHARPDLARVVVLALHTGQRGSDIVGMRFSDLEERADPLTGATRTGIMVKKTKKVGLTLWVPCTAELLAAIGTWSGPRSSWCWTRAESPIRAIGFPTTGTWRDAVTRIYGLYTRAARCSTGCGQVASSGCARPAPPAWKFSLWSG
jgi:hypothetical protein